MIHVNLQIKRRWIDAIYILSITILSLISGVNPVFAQGLENKPNVSQSNPTLEPKAEEPKSDPLDKTMEERSFELRGLIKNPSPRFLIKGARERSQGGYFGIGFRSIRLDLVNEPSLFNNDNNVNGGVFNLGYFTNKYLLEYARHTSILDKQATFTFQNNPIDFIAIVQNNFWFLFSWEPQRDLYFHYGAGVQISEVLLKDISSEFSVLQREGSILIGGGISYFFNPGYFIHYRFTQGIYSAPLSPFLTGQDEENILATSQIHTIFIQYFLPF